MLYYQGKHGHTNKNNDKMLGRRERFYQFIIFFLYCLCSQHLYNSNNSDQCKWKRVKYLLSLPFLGKEAMRQTGKRETERVHGKRLLLIFDPTLIVFSILSLFIKKNKSVINWVFYSQPFNILKQTQWLNQVLRFKVLRCTGGLWEPKTLGVPWCCGSHCWLAFVFWWGLLFSVFSVFCVMSFGDCINLQPQETTKTF